MENVLLSLSSSIFLAVISAIIVAVLALKRFHSEQLWLKKTEAYKEILTALFKVQSYTIYRAGKNLHAEVLSHEDEQRLFERAVEGHDELIRLSAVSTIYLHSDADDFLEKVMPAVRSSRLPDSYCEVENSAVEITTCIERIRGLAKEDLRIKKNFIS